MSGSMKRRCRAVPVYEAEQASEKKKWYSILTL